MFRYLMSKTCRKPQMIFANVDKPYRLATKPYEHAEAEERETTKDYDCENEKWTKDEQNRGFLKKIERIKAK